MSCVSDENGRPDQRRANLAVKLEQTDGRVTADAAWAPVRALAVYARTQQAVTVLVMAATTAIAHVGNRSIV